MHYGDTLRAARERAGLTQTQLAKRLGIKQPYVAKLESSKSVQSYWLEKIAKALKITLCELLECHT